MDKEFLSLSQLDSVSSHISRYIDSKVCTDTATTSSDGLMSSSDKIKLEGIETGAQANLPVATVTEGTMMLDAILPVFRESFTNPYVDSTDTSLVEQVFVRNLNKENNETGYWKVTNTSANDNEVTFTLMDPEEQNTEAYVVATTDTAFTIIAKANTNDHEQTISITFGELTAIFNNGNVDANFASLLSQKLKNTGLSVTYARGVYTITNILDGDQILFKLYNIDSSVIHVNSTNTDTISSIVSSNSDVAVVETLEGFTGNELPMTIEITTAPTFDSGTFVNENLTDANIFNLITTSRGWRTLDSITVNGDNIVFNGTKEAEKTGGLDGGGESDISVSTIFSINDVAISFIVSDNADDEYGQSINILFNDIKDDLINSTCSFAKLASIITAKCHDVGVGLNVVYNGSNGFIATNTKYATEKGTIVIYLDARGLANGSMQNLLGGTGNIYILTENGGTPAEGTINDTNIVFNEDGFTYDDNTNHIRITAVGTGTTTISIR